MVEDERTEPRGEWTHQWFDAQSRDSFRESLVAHCRSRMAREPHREEAAAALHVKSISLGVAALVAIDSFASNVQQLDPQAGARPHGRRHLHLRTTRSSRRGFREFSTRSIRTAPPWRPSSRSSSMAIAIPRSGGTRLAQMQGRDAELSVLWRDLHIAGRRSGNASSKAPNAIVDPALLIALDAKRRATRWRSGTRSSCDHRRGDQEHGDPGSRTPRS